MNYPTPHKLTEAIPANLFARKYVYVPENKSLNLELKFELSFKVLMAIANAVLSIGGIAFLDTTLRRGGIMQLKPETVKTKEKSKKR